MPPFPVLIHCKTVSFFSERSSSRSSFNILRDRPNRYATLHQSVAQKPIRYVTLLFRRSACCSFPLVTEIATSQLSFMCAWTGALSGMILVARAKVVWIVTLHSSMASTCTTERLPQLAHLIKCRRTVRGLRVEFLKYASSARVDSSCPGLLRPP